MSFEEYDFPPEKTEPEHELWLGNKEPIEHELWLGNKEPIEHELWLGNKEPIEHESLNLTRIKDFISLILAYPMRMADERVSKKWVNDVLKFNAGYSTWIKVMTIEKRLMSFQQEKQKEYYDAGCGFLLLLSGKPLRYIEGLIPGDIIRRVKCGQRSMFSGNAPPGQRNPEVLKLTDIDDVIPEAILNMATDLALGQLIQILLSGDLYLRNIHHITFSTRNSTEKQAVIGKLEAAFKDKGNMLGINKTFLTVLRIDVSNYQSDNSTDLQAQREMEDLLELLMRKRNLVLLVDVDGNKKLDPCAVGFPKRKPVGTVVFITIESSTRDNDGMRTAMDLEISTEDHLMPWVLFCRHVGSELVHSSSVIQKIAVNIVQECRSHLLSIVLVARSLKNVEDVKLWESALDKLLYGGPSYDDHNIDCMGISRIMVNVFIHLIWEGMDETKKRCLTRCLSVPKIKDGVVDHHLISDWIRVKLVQTQREANHILRELVDSAVLLQLEGNYIRLPEETYDLLEMLHSLKPFIIKQGRLGLTKPPNIGQWHGTTRIELMDNKLSELPPSPDCPKLRELLLQGNTDLLEIPPLFFDHMPLLQVLDLSHTSIRDLPSSFYNLLELRELYLRGCDVFIELSSEIRQLKNLEKLDLEGTEILDLPKEVQELTNLKSLSVSFCGPIVNHCNATLNTKSTLIPAGLISNLSQLVHLSIDVKPGDERWNKNAYTVLQELSELNSLTSIQLYIPEFKLLSFIPDRLFEHQCSFRFVVGPHVQRLISRSPPAIDAKFKQSVRSLKVVYGMDVPDGINMVLQSADAFFLDRHMTIKHLSEYELLNLKQLRVIILGECNEMQTVFDGKRSNNEDSCLESLTVFYMKNLGSIWEGHAYGHPYFCLLKSLTLHTCPELKTIFTTDFLDSLSKLEELIVEYCPKLNTLISHNSTSTEAGPFLPRLRKVLLLYLPNFFSISSGLHIGQSLEIIGFYCCPKLEGFTISELSSENLKVIKGETMWWESLKWSEQEWGQVGRPNHLTDIFCPINEEADIMNLLSEDGASCYSS